MSTHENPIQATHAPKPTSDRFFGVTFFAVFTVLGLLPLWRSEAMHVPLLSIAVGFLLVALIAPSLLGPLNRAWLRFGALLHHITSPVILGLMFYLVLAPTGLLLRLFGKDLLRLKPDPAALSYWITRDPPGPARDSLDKQF